MENKQHSYDGNVERQHDGTGETVDGNQADDSAGRQLEQAAETPSIELVEVAQGTAVVFGDVPNELDLFDFGLVPAHDRNVLSTVLSGIGNATTVGGNTANVMSSAQGLYRVNEATLSLLKNGGHLAVKDGAKLGAIFKDGQLVAQARFVPVSMTASAVAAIGPAVAMVALQMQLNEISGLVRANIALTEQTLQTINQEQWAELSGLSSSINRAVDQAQQVGLITTSIWENIAGNEPKIDKQLDLYWQKVNAHIQKVHQQDEVARRDYLKANAESILFDSNALLYALKAQAGYQAMRAAHARVVGQHDEDEARLAEVIEQDMHDEISRGVQNARELVAALIRELRIVAELPGRASLPLTKSWRAAKSSRLSCKKLLDSLEPLANALHPMLRNLEVPAVVCAPDDVELDPYLNILRWYMDDDEKLSGVVFAYKPNSHDLTGMVPQVLSRRVDAVWNSLDSGSLASVVDKATSAIAVAITSKRILIAAPHEFLKRGAIEQSIPLADIRFIRPPQSNNEEIRRTIDIITEHESLRLMFPQVVPDKTVDDVIRLVDGNVDVGDEAVAVTALQQIKAEPLPEGRGD